MSSTPIDQCTFYESLIRLNNQPQQGVFYQEQDQIMHNISYM